MDGLTCYYACYKKKKKTFLSCEIEEFVDTHIRKTARDTSSVRATGRVCPHQSIYSRSMTPLTAGWYQGQQNQTKTRTGSRYTKKAPFSTPYPRCWSVEKAAVYKCIRSATVSVRGGTHLFIACLGHLTMDHASLSRRSTLATIGVYYLPGFVFVFFSACQKPVFLGEVKISYAKVSGWVR